MLNLFAINVKIDRAAQAGFDAHRSGAAMPPWVLSEQLTIDAWNAGNRQARDKAKNQAHPVHQVKGGAQ